MKRITRTGIEELSREECATIDNQIYGNNNNEFHYLAFDRQLEGFSPLGCYTQNYPKIREERERIISELVARREVVSLYPEAKLTLYPVTEINGPTYYLEMTNIDQHFADILKLNDEVYKTRYLYIDFGHGAENFEENRELIMCHIKALLENSKLLKEIIVEQ